MGVLNISNCQLYIEDGGTGGNLNRLRVRLNEGDVSYTRTKNWDVIRDRRLLDSFRQGDEEPLQVDFTSTFLTISSDDADPPTVSEALHGEGNAADWVSADTVSDCPTYCVNIVFEHDLPCSALDDEKIVFPKFHVTTENVNFADSTISFSGICLASKPIITRLNLNP